MPKKILLGVVAIVVVLVLVEVVALLRLKSSLKSYADYWKHTPSTGQFTYVALGDSAAQGIGASKPQYGYVGLLASRIQQRTGKTVRTVNLSVSGADIQDVIDKQIPQLKKYKPDLITIEIGANDVARTYNSQNFEKSYNNLASQLPGGTVAGNMPYFGGRIKHNTQAIDADKHIADAAKQYNLKVADLQTITRDRNSIRNYAADYFHPSNRGYQNWSDAFWQQIQPTLE